MELQFHLLENHTSLQWSTVGYWEDGVMTEEYLFWDNLECMKQIGLS